MAATNPTKPYYRRANIGGVDHLHPDSPRKNFQDGNVMGGIVVRIRLR